MNRTVVVTSIFSQQQSAVAEAFHQKGWVVRGTSRQAAPHPFARIFQVNSESGDGLADAFRDADVVAASVTQNQQRPGAMPAMAEKIARAGAQAGVKRIIYNLAARIIDTSDEGPFPDMREARSIIEKGLVPSTVLQPTVYMDNLLAPWTLLSLNREGALVYPVPADAPVAWISHRSLAGFFVASAENQTAANKEYLIAGPEPLITADLVRILSQRLGKEITFIRLPLAEMTEVLNQTMGRPAGDRITRLYAELDNMPMALSTSSAAAAELNIRPESFIQFVARNEWDSLAMQN